MNFIPPSFSFHGDPVKARSLKGQALQFYNYVVQQAERSGINFISRRLTLPDGSLITMSSQRGSSYSNRMGRVAIYASAVARRVEARTLDLIIKTVDGVFKVTRSGDSVTLEDFDKPVGFDGCWVNQALNLACSRNGDGELLISGSAMVFPEGFYDANYILRFAALTANTCAFAYESDVDTIQIATLGENGSIQFVDELTYPVLNRVIFASTTTSSRLVLHIVHSNSVFLTRTYQKNASGGYDITDNVIIDATPTTQRAVTLCTLPVVTLVENGTETEDMFLSAGDYSEIMTSTNGIVFGDYLCDTFTIPTIDTRNEWSTKSDIIRYEPSHEIFIDNNPDPFVYDETNEYYFHVTKVLDYYNQLTTSIINGNSDVVTTVYSEHEEFLYHFNVKVHVSFDVDVGMYHFIYPSTKDAHTYFTIPASSGSSLEVFFSDQQVVVYEEVNIETSEGNQSAIVTYTDHYQTYITGHENSISVTNSLISVDTEASYFVVMINNIEVYRYLNNLVTTPDVNHTQDFFTFDWGFPDSNIDTDISSTIESGGMNSSPPLGINYAYTDTLYALSLPNGEVLIFPVDNKVVQPRVLANIPALGLSLHSELKT
jgi:hypothetical protein